MRVKAKQVGEAKYVGYYNFVRRKAGDVFDLTSESDFNKTWMDQVGQSEEKTPAPGEPPQEFFIDLKDTPPPRIGKKIVAMFFALLLWGTVNV